MINLLFDNIDITTAADKYIPVPVTGQVVKAVAVVTGATTAGAGLITLAQGSTTIGTITVATGATVGTIDTLVMDSTTLGRVEVGPTKPIKITLDGTPTTGVVNLVLTISEFHGEL